MSFGISILQIKGAVRQAFDRDIVVVKKCTKEDAAAGRTPYRKVDGKLSILECNKFWHTYYTQTYQYIRSLFRPNATKPHLVSLRSVAFQFLYQCLISLFLYLANKLLQSARISVFPAGFQVIAIKQSFPFSFYYVSPFQI